MQLVVFALGDQRYALRLDTVERVLRAVEITPLPKAPEVVLGVVDVHGTVVPAVDLRRRFRLPPRELEPSDRMIIARTSQRRLALVVESVPGLTEIPEDQIAGAATLPPGTGYLEGVAILDDGLVIIHDLDQLIAFQEDRELEAALPRAKRGRER